RRHTPPLPKKHIGSDLPCLQTYRHAHFYARWQPANPRENSWNWVREAGCLPPGYLMAWTTHPRWCRLITMMHCWLLRGSTWVATSACYWYGLTARIGYTPMKGNLLILSSQIPGMGNTYSWTRYWQCFGPEDFISW